MLTNEGYSIPPDDAPEEFRRILAKVKTRATEQQFLGGCTWRTYSMIDLPFPIVARVEFRPDGTKRFSTY